MKISLSRLLTIGGAVVAVAGLGFMVWLYWPVIIAEYQYRYVWSKVEIPTVAGLVTEVPAEIQETKKEPELVPVNTWFSITIPRLHTSAPLIANVDANDSQAYQRALQNGVAHAAGSSVPNAPGITFLFAHSSANQLIAKQYNAVFYLLNKMEKDDDILVYFNGVPYHYKVTKLQVVNPDEISSLEQKTGPQQLVLMTCTPAGTTLRRLLVYADFVSSDPLP